LARMVAHSTRPRSNSQRRERIWLICNNLRWLFNNGVCVLDLAFFRTTKRGVAENHKRANSLLLASGERAPTKGKCRSVNEQRITEANKPPPWFAYSVCAQCP
jgi:hypothetical protein